MQALFHRKREMERLAFDRADAISPKTGNGMARHCPRWRYFIENGYWPIYSWTRNSFVT
ncbi:hypothetical protein [Siminovitchia sp. 179-K 8D1 HS]|uniref:hypothetical protein n=1 Tax=Siminovitchia sp. 179-K 8D1 HS TaxID=3142385 RepID=UPI0039A025E2